VTVQSVKIRSDGCAVNDGIRPSFRNLGTGMTVHDEMVDDTVQNLQKGPRNGILTLSSFSNVACALFVQANVGVSMK